MKAQFPLFSLKQGWFARTSLHFWWGQSAGKLFQGWLRPSAHPGPHISASLISNICPPLSTWASKTSVQEMFFFDCGTFSEQTSYTGKTRFQIQGWTKHMCLQNSTEKQDY